MPVRRHMPIAALLSAQAWRSTEKPRSRATDTNPSPLGGTLHDARQFSCAGVQGDGFLRQGPLLDCMSVPRGRSSASRAPRDHASGELC
eukprot:10767752-Alexandrium_andersonii.AAC.1